MKKLDKDRFRRDMGGVENAYEEIMKRLMGENCLNYKNIQRQLKSFRRFLVSKHNEILVPIHFMKNVEFRYL